MSKDTEKDADIPGRRRAGTVATHEMLEAMGLITLHVQTTNSRTFALVVEDWLVKMGALHEDARHYSTEDFERLCQGAKESAQTHGPVRKLPS